VPRGRPAGPPGPAGPLALILLLAAAAWLHAPALRLPFFADDYLFLDQVRDRALPAVLTAPDPLGNFFRPVGRQLWFWTLSHAGGESPLVFHLANLLVFLLIVALVFLLAQRLAGTAAALVAGGLLAVHYAADVPVRWASGGQDLLAVAAALGALLLHVKGRSRAAGAMLLVGLLSKETVLFTPVVAILLGRREGEPWSRAARRAWPLFAATAAWAALWLAMTARVGGAGALVERDAVGVAAALAHFGQAFTGIEWPGLHMPSPEDIGTWGPLVLVIGVLAMWVPRAKEEAGASGRTPAIAGGVAWALLGALPVAAVASAWSAYYYLFAVCGAALALGAALSRTPPGVAVAAVALLGVTTQVGRGIEEFATAERIWNTQSRVNRFYVDRSMRYVGRYLDDMKSQQPQLPPQSTVFFSGIPGFVAWQAADGPLVRWAYRDSSLRSYYLSALTVARVHRGPAFFFTAAGDSLTEIPPESVLFSNIGMIMLLDGNVDVARDAWALHVAEHPDDGATTYWLGMLEAISGDSTGVRRLQSIGVSLASGPTPEIDAALKAVAAGDTSLAWRICFNGVARHGADPNVHALFSDLSMARVDTEGMGIFEAWLVYRMAPDHPAAMRRWAGVLVQMNRFDRGAELFERYLAAGGEDAETNASVRRWLGDVKRRMKGGDLAGEGLRRSMR